jgi:long-chain acyl-CoA synthetase
MRKLFQERVTENLYVRYGSTETGTISIAGPEDHLLEGSVGKPLGGVSLDIGSELAPIKVKTPGMAVGYLDPTDEQSASFEGDWFVPGDLGFMSSSGQIIIAGRTGEAFTLDGVNIFPREIESVLLTHPDIMDSVVVRRDSQFHDGLPVAFVKLNNQSSLGEIELLNWARDKMGLAGPRQGIFVHNFPATDQGKIDISALKDSLR